MSPRLLWWLGNTAELIHGIEQVRSIIADRNTKTAALLSAVYEVAAFSGTGGVMVTGMLAPRPVAPSSGAASSGAKDVAIVAAPPLPEAGRKWNSSEVIDCAVCGSAYRRSNHSFHVKSQKHQAAELKANPKGKRNRKGEGTNID